eukprot:CAMPEP_0184325948 /NCGR_PEP_ID=MMETSP1049-20130417/142305_1 /TAXON_ID=77928 /ORGANISM="Proteomonas sulcata, Strain CCMP704" /LENGTH=46 /DNA_ID= /DNA_START= /DNA_END= /DNA_ORIENTATION=
MITLNDFNRSGRGNTDSIARRVLARPDNAGSLCTAHGFHPQKQHWI